MTAHTSNDLPEEDAPEKPSKSERKRVAHAAQDLGEALIRLRDSDLDALGLPERLSDAIRAARHIKSRAAGARQRQYIGKLMREIDAEPIRTALAARSERDALETQLFKRAEDWRERLITEGETALAELARLRPGLERKEWSRRVAAARHERGADLSARSVGPAGRELFRALRALLDSGSSAKASK
ncbi:MAG TPA: ribosome biogenesis factor YjgA [Steroidobacteraceae bacterium]|nr:ribosome biogenesis factor YjgA [Steroidobacteraceae bacterium]